MKGLPSSRHRPKLCTRDTDEPMFDCLRTRLPLRVPRHWRSRRRAAPTPTYQPSRTACALISFPASKPTCSLTLAALDALRVDDDFRWAHLSLPINSDPIVQMVMHLQSSINAPVAEIGIHRLPSRKITGQRAPATTFTEHVKALRMSPCSQNGTTTRFRWRNQVAEQFKLFWSQVAGTHLTVLHSTCSTAGELYNNPTSQTSS